MLVRIPSGVLRPLMLDCAVSNDSLIDVKNHQAPYASSLSFGVSRALLPERGLRRWLVDNGDCGGLWGGGLDDGVIGRSGFLAAGAQVELEPLNANTAWLEEEDGLHTQSTISSIPRVPPSSSSVVTGGGRGRDGGS